MGVYEVLTDYGKARQMKCAAKGDKSTLLKGVR